MMWFKWVMVGVLTLSALGIVGDIGTERKPILPPEGMALVFGRLLAVAGLLYYWR